MPFVKSIFGTVVSEEFTLQEGGIAETIKPQHFEALEREGVVIVRNTYEEAKNVKFRPSRDLFNESYLSLNPPEGVTPPAPSIDFTKARPMVIGGVPASLVDPADSRVRIEAAKELANIPKVEPTKVETIKVEPIVEPIKVESLEEEPVKKAVPVRPTSLAMRQAMAKQRQAVEG